tara:strand:+ start:78 stop:479 length:402 start_codon:yes stop_codon:yes gene_type:complete
MNSIYPEYTEFDKAFDQTLQYNEDRKLRLHVTRYTDYGERYKLFVFPIDKQTSFSLLELTGIDIEANNNGFHDVVNMEFMGQAEKMGIQFYDEITNIDISTIGRPAKEYVYIFGLLLLLLTVQLQRISIKKYN